MEKFVFAHSQKNIPIPSKKSYLKTLIAKTEDFIQRLRWKTFFFLNPNENSNKKNTYGFKTQKTAPQIPELNNFEKDLADLINNIKFTKWRNTFQRELKTKVTEINKTKGLLVRGDKTSNIYHVSKNDYSRLLSNNITKDYKRTNYETVDKTNAEAKKIAEKLELEDRIEQYSEAKAFITLKDHKEDFDDDPKCRLINPAKTNIGKISKQILQKANQEVRSRLGLQQWQSTDQVTKWFKEIRNKASKSFLQFDIVEFYPSITKELLDKALNWASRYTEITEDQKEIIHHARKSLLFSQNPNVDDQNPATWTKQKNEEFDVTMGAPDGAEICEMVGLFLLKEINENFPQLNAGLYRDDGLAHHNRIGSRRMKLIHAKLRALFESHGLKITIEKPNKKVVNFLDVKLNLRTNTFCPYRKPNDTTKYINVKSNHPPTVIKGVPKAINQRLSRISSSVKEFDEAKETYQRALDESGFKYTLKYQNPEEDKENKKKKKKKKKRNILWYNPPFNMTVTTKIGKRFLTLLDTHFPKKHKLHKLINRQTVKLSYSCTKNIQTIMQAHNATITNPTTKNRTKRCSCRNPDKCPLENDCAEQKDVIYHAKLEEGDKKQYIGCAQDFKKRYYGHTESFRNEASKTKTTLSNHVWDQNLAPEPKIKWSILAKAPSYKKGNRYCDLCLTEKLFILANIEDNSYLNKRSELAQKCRHKAKFLLQNCPG